MNCRALQIISIIFQIKLISFSNDNLNNKSLITIILLFLCQYNISLLKIFSHSVLFIIITMSSFDDDILQPISNNDLHQYVDILKENLPKNTRAHHFILMQLKWKNYFMKHSTETYSARGIYNFFTHRNGKRKNCTFVAITIEGNPNHVDVCIHVI